MYLARKSKLQKKILKMETKVQVLPPHERLKSRNGNQSCRHKHLNEIRQRWMHRSEDIKFLCNIHSWCLRFGCPFHQLIQSGKRFLCVNE